jgi:hypothetical protein
VSTAALLIVTGLLRYFGVGGYRGGFWICFIALGALALGTFVLAARPDLRSGVSYSIALTLLAATAASWLLAVSPPSSGRLAQRLDAVDLPYYELQSQKASGSSTCRPICPRLRRTYRGPATGARAALINAAVALDAEGLLGPPRLRRPFAEPNLDERVDRLRVLVRTTRTPSNVELTIELRVTR